MKVSVIIPVYNVEKYVEECLRSVMNQTLKDIEIICIEDAGADSSKDIIKRLMGEDSRISLFVNEENMGLASVRNLGMEKAKGEYIYFLDSDDMIKKEALYELYTKAESETLDACIFAADFIYENEELEKKFSSNPAVYKGSYPSVMNGKELYIKWMKVWDWMPSQPRYFYRRDFLEKNSIRFVEGQLHEDESFAFDVLMNAERVRIIKDAYFIRRFRAASIMSSCPTMKNVESVIEILQHVEDYANNYVVSDNKSFRVTEEELKQAISFYYSKLFKDVTRKLRAVKASGQEIIPSEKFKHSKCKMDLLEQVKKKSYIELFACSSYYQVMIALVKALAEGIEIDIVLEEHGIETANELAKRISSVMKEYVNHVYVCSTSSQVEPYEQKETSGNADLSERLIHHVENMFGGLDVKTFYDKINIFWDLGYVGTYLNIKNISYILHEDSLNSYKFIKKNRPNYSYIFDDKLREKHVGVIPFGYSDYCCEVEVNDMEGIEIPHDKVKKCSREKLINSLDDESKKLIFKSFVSEDFSLENIDSSATLLLTEPFALTGRLPDEESQIRLYRELIEKYGKDGYVVIKAHPRDTVDYKRYFPKAVIIEKNMPMEVLNFDKRVHFELAVTVSSSVINGLENVDGKVYLGTDYLQKYI